MPNRHSTLSSLFTAIANQLRIIKGSTSSISADNFPDELEDINDEISIQNSIIGQISAVLATKRCGGSMDGVNVETLTKTVNTTSPSIQFSGLLGEPTSFVVVSAATLTTGASPYKTAAVVFDGINTIGQFITNTSNAQVTYSSSAFTKSYSGGTLTITGTNTNFQANQYKLIYSYGGSTLDVKTVDVQVGSGATSIDFTVDNEPKYFSCIFKTNLASSSGYSRANIITGDGTNIFGLHMGSSDTASTNSWTTSYSNGTFTIQSSSTTSGGYFHQPGYYQLTYIPKSGSEYGGDIVVNPLIITENGTYTAPSGTAYSPISVNVPSSGENGGNVGTVTATPSTNATTVTFSGLQGQPTWFIFLPNANVPAQTTTHRVVTHTFDGSTDIGFSIYSNNAYGGTYNAYRDATNFSHTYSNGSLTLNSGGANLGGYYYNTVSMLIYGY